MVDESESELERAATGLQNLRNAFGRSRESSKSDEGDVRRIRQSIYVIQLKVKLLKFFFRGENITKKAPLTTMPTLDDHENWCDGPNPPQGGRQARWIADYLTHDKQPHVCKTRGFDCEDAWTSEHGNPLKFLKLDDQRVLSGSNHKYCVHRWYTDMRKWNVEQWDRFIDNIGSANLSSDIVSVYKEKVMDKVK